MKYSIYFVHVFSNRYRFDCSILKLNKYFLNDKVYLGPTSSAFTGFILDEYNEYSSHPISF